MDRFSKREETIDLFERYKGLLTQTQSQAIYLHYIEDLSLAEIAEIVATSRSAVHDAIKKAEKKLYKIHENLSD